jgi:hypothetical protein
MFLRSWLLLLLSGLGALVSAQGLPWYVTDSQYPARSATGVATNSVILLVVQRRMLDLTYPLGPQYTLKNPAGTTVALKSPAGYYDNSGITPISIFPTSSLAPLTKYTFTITPPASVGDPYSFDFTTGAGPDTAAPQIVGFDPKSGTANTGISGPFTVLFNKRLLTTSALTGQAIQVFANGGSPVQAFFSMTTDGTGLIVRPQPQSNYPNYWPSSYQITVDPAKVVDLSGNTGQGAKPSAQYLTFVASDTDPLMMRGFFPADGDSGLPLNVAIRVLFTHVVDSSTIAAGMVVDSNGTTVPVRVNAFANGYGVELKPSSLLAANQTYRVRVTNGLRDQQGFVAGATSFQFTTGADPDLTPAQAVAVDPTYGLTLAANVPVSLRTNKPIMPLAAVEYSTLGSPQANGAGMVNGTASISPDGRTFTMLPSKSSHNFQVSLSDVVDYTGASFTSTVVSDVRTAPEDYTPPAVLAANPPDGATGIGTAATISLVFSEVLSAALSGDFVRLSANGQPIASKVTVNGNLVTVAPASSATLSPGTTYLVELNGASDLAGNVAAPYSFQFTTGGSPLSGVAKLISTSPAAGDQGVDVNTSITFNFDSPINPLTAIPGSSFSTGFQVADAAFGVYPAVATVSGSSLVITPLHPLLHDSLITATVGSTDTSGRFLSASIQFRTGPNPDTTAFQVTSVSPADGSVVNTPDHSVTVTLSKPVNPASYAGGGISVYSSGAIVSAKVQRSANDQSLIITPAQSGPVTIVLDSRLTDVAGNALSPFRATYTFAQATDTQAYPSVVALRPANGSIGVPANSPVCWFLSKHIDLASVNASLMVVADGQLTAGKFELSTDGQVLTFRPDAPFAPGAVVRFYERNTLFMNYANGFTVETGPFTPLSVTRTSMSNSQPANAVIEVEFSSEVSTGQGLISLRSTSQPAGVVPTTESHPRPRVLRLTPKSTLIAGSYQVVVSQIAVGSTYSFTVTSAVTVPAAVMVVGPRAGETAVPTNVSIRAGVTTPINRLSIIPANFTISAAGRSIASIVYVSNTGFAVTPLEALPPNTTITASISGVEDQYGQAIPARSWQFTTGSGPDFTQPVLLESNVPPQGSCLSGSCPYPELPANAAITLRYDRPLDPQLMSTAPLRSSSVQFNLQISLSDDLRTVILTPNPAWAKGQQYSYLISTITDLKGMQTGGSPNTSFYAAFDTDRTPPQLLALSPADGMSGLPLNAQIIAAFDKTVLSNSTHSVRLLEDGNPVPLVTFQDDLQRLRFAPVAPLAARTTYTLVFEGVTDASGNAMAGTVTRTFTTGDLMDTAALTGDVYCGNSNGAATNIPLRVIFNKPVSPASVDSRTIPFRKASAIASSYYWIPAKATYSISDDGMTVTVIPVDPLIPGWPYQVLVGGVRDFAGNAATSFYSLGFPAPVFTEGFRPDTTAPVATLVPADGTTGVPLNTRLAAVFYETILPQPATSIFQITRDGQPVPGKTVFSSSSATFTFTPETPLAPNTTYRIDVAGVTDLAGNVSVPVSSTFTTTSSTTNTAGSFQMTSSSPANQEAGVGVTSPLVMRFNRPVDPSSVGVIAFLSSFPITGTFTTSDSTVTFTPTEAWPAAAIITVLFTTRFNATVLDLAGNRLSSITQLSFRTAASPDTTPPQLIANSPQAGTLLLPPNATLSLTFSETVAVTGSGLVLFAGSQQSSSTGYSYDPNDPHTIMVNANVPSNSQLTLVGSDGIVDRAGNALAQPFSLQYPTGAADPPDRPVVNSMTPNTGSPAVPPQTVIILRFNKSMDTGTLVNAIRVTQDGQSVTGKLDFLDSNRSAQFTPDGPLRAGSRIDVFVLESAADPAGLTLYQRYDGFFTIAGTAPATNPVLQTSFGASVAAGAWLEVAFGRPVDPASVSTDHVWLRAGRLLLPGSVTLRGDRILRFLPDAPMASGVEHTLTVSAGIRSIDGVPARPEDFHFGIAEDRAAEVASIEILTRFGRPAVHVVFTGPIDPLAVDAIRLYTRTAGDEEIAVIRHLSLDLREAWLMPTAARADLESATVRLNGFTDRGGRRVTASGERK